MAEKTRRLSSPPPWTPLTPSPAFTATRLSPLTSGTLTTYPVTSSPFSSSPTLSHTRCGSTDSPDLFDDFEYCEDMDLDFRRIDVEAAEVFSSPPPSMNNRVLVPATPPPPPARDQKTWVVFRGKAPGVYDDGLNAAMQTQGHSDAFQRVFPDFDTAKAAWLAYVEDQVYPDYGKGPWVVFLGRRPGVFTRVSELEGCVKGYEGAIFRSCSSIAQGKIKFQIFAEQVARMFAGPDLFTGVEALVPRHPEEGDSRAKIPTVRSIAPVPVVPKHSPPPPASQVAESSRAASKRNASNSLLVPLPHRQKISRPGDGWYVAHNADLPGVYYGVSALKNANPVPGGFHCARDQESADQLFHDLTIRGAIVWASERE